jgi:hypothetical protein
MSLSTELAAIAATLEAELPLLRQALEPASWYGTAWPSSPTNNVPFYRTDLGLWAYFDGAMWLSVNQYETSFVPRTALPWAVGGSGEGLDLAGSPSYSRKISSVVLSYYINTTNNSSNYWTITAQTSVGGSPANISSAAASPNTWNTIALGFSPSSQLPINIVTARTGSPGSIYVLALMRYRLII